LTLLHQRIDVIGELSEMLQVVLQIPLRVGTAAIDASGVHPEAYPVVRRILAATRS
jgi:hypothetical protein